MKILLVNSANVGGVEYYRMISPNHYLSKMYPEFEFLSVPSLKGEYFEIGYSKIYNNETGKVEETIHEPGKRERWLMDDFIKQYDLVHFCRAIDVYGDTEVTDRLKRLGIPFGIDFDDYWHLPTYHILYKDYIETKKPEAMIQAIKDAHFVTCTTPILAKYISEHNENVHIIENGLDHELESWCPDPIRKERLRFGFYQGSTHMKGIKACSDSIVKVFYDQQLKGKFQIILAGFNAKANEPSYYIGYERALTDNLQVLNSDPYYQQYLQYCVKTDNQQFLDKPYVRIWGVHIDDWPYTYHFSDVSVIPLMNDTFSSCKSELKLIEAGMKGKATIVSNVAPYTLLATDKNSYLCTEGLNSFYKKIKRAINNPNEVWDKAAQLREDVLAKHSLKVLTEKRKQIYEHYAVTV